MGSLPLSSSPLARLVRTGGASEALHDPSTGPTVRPTGLRAIDEALPLGGLPRGAVTELDGEPEDMVFALPKELRITLLD